MVNIQDNKNHMFLNGNSNGISFIANVNKVANEIGTLKELLELPNTLNEIKDNTEDLKEQTQNIYSNTIQIKNETNSIKEQVQQTANNVQSITTQNVEESTKQAQLSETYANESESYLNLAKQEHTSIINDINIAKENIRVISNTTKEYMNKSKEYSDNSLEYSEDAKRYAYIAENAANKVDTALTLEAGIQNLQNIYLVEKEIKSGEVIRFDEVPYYVGRATLHISWEGVELYNGVHYKEIGKDGEVSRTVQFLLPIPSNNKICVWSISSNIVREIHDNLEEIKDIQEDVANKREEVADDLEEVKYWKDNIEDTVKLAHGISNLETTFTVPTDINIGDVLEFDTFKYYVGRCTLRMNWEGVELYRGIHFEEVGENGELSYQIKMLISIPANNKLNVWAIASNISRAVEEAEELNKITEELLNKAEEVNKESEKNANIASNAAQESTEQADRAEEAADDAELAAKRAELNACLINKNGLMTLQNLELLEFAPNGMYIISPLIAVPALCGLPLLSVSSIDKIPEGDCFYVLTIDIELDCGEDTKPDVPVNPDKPDNNNFADKATAICGKRIKTI